MSDKPGGISGLPKDDDEDVDLGISLQAVANIIDAARASDEIEEDANEDVDTETPDAAKPTLPDETLETLIDELNEEEQAALVALAWVGRGDYEPDEWNEALKAAQERNESSTSLYLTGMDLLGDLLAEGLAAFGIVVEEIER
jgi:hypothetical protein